MNKPKETYWKNVRKRFAKNRLALWSFRFLMVLVFVALTGDFIANQKPFYCKIDGASHFPICRAYLVDLGLAKPENVFKSQDWHDYAYEYVIWPPIPYSAQSTDTSNAGTTGPFDEQAVKSRRFRHILGTDNLGRDVAAGLIAGTRTAFQVGLVAMSIATIIGIFFGAIAGFFGDYGLFASRGRILVNIIGLPLSFFWAFMSRAYIITEAQSSGPLIFSILLFGLLLSGFNLIGKALNHFAFFRKKVQIPADLLIMRLIEIIGSVPALLLILAFLAIIQNQSLIYIMLIIGLISWQGIARLVRAELIRIRSLEYIEASRSLGLPEWRILLKHALPNALTPVFVSISFGIAGAILVEATLSFLGIGVSPEQVTWGSMLQRARGNISAWWLAIFPGLAIFVTVTMLNLIGEGLTDALDSKNSSKQR